MELDDDWKDDEAHAAGDKETRKEKRRAVEAMLGKYPGDMEEYRISFEQAEELVKLGVIDMDYEFDRGATFANIIELLGRHRELRATGFLMPDGSIVLDGFDTVTDDTFSPETIQDFVSFAVSYADEVNVVPKQLFMWFD